MATRVKGITIEFRGDTTKLDKALREVKSETKDVDKALRDVNNALKFNPHNTELLAQKQTLLGQKVTQTKEQLNLLRQAQAKLDDDPSVDKTSQEYMELRRQIVTTESKLDHFTKEAKKLNNVKLTKLSGQLKKVGDKMRGAGTTMTQNVTAPIVAGFTASAKYASDYEENLNKLDVAFGSNSKSVKDWANTAMQSYGMSKVQATEAAAAFGALGKGIGLTEADAASMATTLTGLSADLGSYFNTSTDESAKALEGIFTGESEALKKFGVVMTDTNLKQFAADQGLVWDSMTQGEKTTLRYQYVLAKTKDAQGDFSRTSDGTANSLKIFKASLQDLATAIGTNLLPIITPVIQKFAEWVQKFGELSPTTQKVITIIGLVVAALGPLLVIIGSIASAIGSIIGLAGTLGISFTAMLGPVGWVAAAIAALVAIGVALYKNWDKVKAMAGKLKDGVVTAFKAAGRGIKTAVSTWFKVITAPFRLAWNGIKAIIQKIKDVFKFKISLPKIKLPHFAIHPEGWQLGDLLQGSIPSLGIDWYAKGGIFRNPSVIGVGEAGPEAVLPIDKLQTMMMAMADSIVNGIAITNQMQAAGAGGDLIVQNYLYPSGPKMGETTVKMYDTYKKILG